MHGLILIIHIVLCVLLVLVILIQSGRSGGISGLFGGGGDALFSTSSQQSGIRNATIVIAGLFFLTSLALTMLATRERGQFQSVFNRNMAPLPPLNLPAQPTAPGTSKSNPANPPGAPVKSEPISNSKAK